MFIPRTLAQTSEGPGRGAVARAILVGALLALALFVILAAPIIPGQVSIRVGDVATEDIRAPRSVSFISQSQTAAAQQEAEDRVAPVYDAIRPLADIRADQLRDFDRVANQVGAVLDRVAAGNLTAEELPAALESAVPSLNQSQITQIGGMSSPRWEAVAAAGRAALESVYAGPIREDELSDARQQARNNVTEDLAQQDRELAGDLAAANVVATSEVSAEKTEQARQAARDGVEPVVTNVVEGTIVVRDGDQVTQQDVEKLEELGLTGPRANTTALLGNLLVALLTAGLIVGFLWRFQPELWYRNRSLLLFMLSLVVTAIAMRIAADRAVWSFVIPTSATVLLVGLLLGGPAGAAVATALAVLAGVMNREGLEPALYVLGGGIASLLAIVRAERLNAFLRAGLLLALSNITVLVAFSLLDQRDIAAVVQGVTAGAVNAGLSVFLAVGSFAMLGNLFGIMTVFQLLELANPSSRLLRRLLLETPGTYHHSVMVGNLAERAAETIGADPLLARVAAYYHDVGKMKNPLAFIENQAGARNIHDDLTAETSARIIASHIRDGIDLGYEYGLPVQIIGFIPQHHGTSVMSYFYGKALREVGGNEELVNRDTFRYPGPKPQSPEAAILMLSDGVEASVRSLDEKDEPSIRAMVDRIVDARVEDGQLDDADLTLKNIAQIKEAFVQQLLGMYHQRIKYPDNVVPLERREQA
jgi:putative nucleotidyltransferase with HDIG domain